MERERETERKEKKKNASAVKDEREERDLGRENETRDSAAAAQLFRKHCVTGRGGLPVSDRVSPCNINVLFIHPPTLGNKQKERCNGETYANSSPSSMYPNSLNTQT